MISSVKQKSYSLHAGDISIGVVWLFQLSGVIGISLGYEQWFISKTPIILCLTFILLVVNFPVTSIRSALLTCFFFAVGMLAEYIGVTYSILFGEYSYGNNLGLRMEGVPYLIGLYWALLVLVTGVSANSLSANKPARILIGAIFMVTLDFFMEQSAPVFEYWSFTGGVAPLSNYVTWFVLAAILHIFFQRFQLSGGKRFSMHVLTAQFFFFIYFYVFNNI
jgi:putative membrane protein